MRTLAALVPTFLAAIMFAVVMGILGNVVIL